ncbi:M15 family metallopeptidase [Oceanimonas sp. CHS3-5]|uniref:M15 family metallopeptidase n=1 Tax=Oceanimonas sp. CHS3-5 TaxID=3068186 RepID=UPI00273E160D|nr:M15 family metallopeptidase [Oceanimonas sp. CHS3-5]MDP5291002.1 M15 family metallopeptidase [Oceanimonas sp. CHS3-5]
MMSACLLGLDERHLVPLAEPGHRLRAEAREAFVALQAAAAGAGFNLAPASSFRGFERQLAIWNGKFDGSRPLLDADSRPQDALALSEPERIHAILRWSALPGTSRHHWGTDLDIYDPSLLPAGGKLQLEPWEYEQGGYFYPLSQWLNTHMQRFGFYLPYAGARGVGAEPWHLSYRPLARECEHQLTPALLANALATRPILGKTHILNMLDDIFARYIYQ